MSSDCVDPDDVGTWPGALVDALAPHAQRARSRAYDDGEPFAASDLAVPLSNAEVVDLLGGRPLRVVHATRLLPHEVDGIRREGLRALTPKHVAQRLADAERVGALSNADAHVLRATTVYALDNTIGREGQVCAVLGTYLLAQNVRAFGRLLTDWGGEAIYWGADEEARQWLRSLGRPSIVVADIPPGMLLDALTFPYLARALRDCLAGLPERSAAVHIRHDVPGPAVTAVWQPGMPDYDRFPDMPR